MTFWKPTKTKKKEPRSPDSGQAVPARKKIHHSSPVVFEAKMLAIEAVNCGADRQDIAKILGINPSTISNWLKLYRDEGIKGLCRKPSNKVLRKQCTELEKRIIAHRTENPDHGVRRIRDELRSKEGLAVSAEKVRQTVNAANGETMATGATDGVISQRVLPVFYWFVAIRAMRSSGLHMADE